MGKIVWKWTLRVIGYALLFLSTLGLGIYFGNIAIYGCAVADIGLLLFVYSLVLDEPEEDEQTKERRKKKG